MRAYELLEGGWESVATQSTTINPSVVKQTLKVVSKFTADFNNYLSKHGVPEVEMGHPLGSSAYYDVDDDDKIYGDIDLQMIAPAIEGKSVSQFAAFYNKYLNDFVKQTKPAYIHDEGKEIKGHPIFKLGTDAYVQVDMLWAPDNEAEWARYRSTPERGVKGLVYGSLYSSLGAILNMSIQSSGAQMKIKDGTPVNFARSRKVDSVETLSMDQENFGLEILKGLFERVYPDRPLSDMKVDAELKANPGIDKTNLTMDRLIAVIKGLGKSLELNDMFGKYNVPHIDSYRDYLQQFVADMKAKMEKSKNASKFNKAETPAAIAQVKKTRKQIDDAFAKVLELVKA